MDGANAGAPGNACDDDRDPRVMAASWDDKRVERRAPCKAAAEIACRHCGARVSLDTRRMRLRHTAVELICPSCALVMWVRRQDTYRDPDVAVAWTFSSYSGQADEHATAKRRRRAHRWAHRRRR